MMGISNDLMDIETIIFVLKRLLMDATVCNNNLKQVVSFLLWSLEVEKSNSRIRKELNDSMNKSINSLEELLHQRSLHKINLQKALEKYEYDLNAIRTQLSYRKGEDYSYKKTSKPIMRKSIAQASFMKRSSIKVKERLSRIFTAQLPIQNGAGGLIGLSGLPGLASRKSMALFGLQNNPTLPNTMPKIIEEKKEEESMSNNSSDEESKTEEKPEVNKEELKIPLELVQYANNYKSPSAASQPSNSYMASNEELANIESELRDAKVELESQKTLSETLLEELKVNKVGMSTLNIQLDTNKASSEKLLNDI